MFVWCSCLLLFACEFQLYVYAHVTSVCVLFLLAVSCFYVSG